MVLERALSLSLKSGVVHGQVKIHKSFSYVLYMN